jgi:hypothetical protein
MGDTNEYLQFAVRCFEFADRPETSNLNRKLLFEMAITWRDLAEEARVEAKSVETLSKTKLQ